MTSSTTRPWVTAAGRGRLARLPVRPHAGGPRRPRVPGRRALPRGRGHALPAGAGTELGVDGRWSAEPSGTAPYRTRVLVYRPVDAGRFNGTVVLHWNNVTRRLRPVLRRHPRDPRRRLRVRGSPTQRVGIHGLPTAPQGLQAWDPERYATLSIGSDDDSYDIFTQAARAVGPDRDRTTDPLGGLDVERVIAMGSSQSAGRLATYVNAIHPLARAIDGFLLLIYFGSGTPLAVGDEVVNIVSPSQPFDARTALRGRNRLRDDLDVPVMVVNSELEAISCQPVRQPNTDRFRYWEAAGTCHVSQQAMDVRAPKYERDFGTPLPMPPNVNHVSMTPLYDAALHHLHRWLATGKAPPAPPLIDFAGDPPEVVRDEHGIARGGIRLPQVEVPIARNSAIPVADDIFSVLYGSSVPFPAAESGTSTATPRRSSPGSRRRPAPPSGPATCSPVTSPRSSTRPGRPSPRSPPRSHDQPVGSAQDFDDVFAVGDGEPVALELEAGTACLFDELEHADVDALVDDRRQPVPR